MTKIYREAHGLFFCNAICYNHESPRRGENFVTRKVTLAAARIKAGLQKSVSLGDLDSARDWGYAKDFVQAMWLMLQQDKANDYVLATGESHTIRELLQVAFSHVGLNWQEHVKIDKRFNRPADAHELLGNPVKAERQLGWCRTATFEELICLLVDEDLKIARDRVSARNATSSK
jgi:GDPmannose 4,6-dehydratase